MRITTLLPSTGFERPTGAELRALLKIVRTEHELPPIGEGEFARAFWAVGFQFRLAEPDTSLHFQSHVDHCNNLLSRYNHGETDGAAVLAAIVAHSDIPYRLADRAKGQLLEIGMNPFSGIGCANTWRAVLAGQPPMTPLPPKPIPLRPVNSVPRPRFYQEDGNGRMNEFNPAPWMR